MTSMRVPVALLLGLLLTVLVMPVTAAEPSSSPGPGGPVPSPVGPHAPDPTPMPTPGTGGLEPGVLDWEPVGPPYIRRVRYLSEVVPWSGGFAALGTLSTRRGLRELSPSAWRSIDGRSWSRVRLPSGLGEVVDLLPFRDGLVIVADEQTDFRHRRVDLGFWRSSDAVTWERVGGMSYRLPGYLERRGCQANHRDVAGVDGALMVYVTLCWDPCCGSITSPIALASVEDGDRRRTGGVIAWRSTDGAAWRRQPLRGMDRPDEADDGIELRTAPGELLVLRKEGGGHTLLRSPDGIRWTSFGTAPDGFDHQGGTLEFVPVGENVLLLGESWDTECCYGNQLHGWVMEANGDTTHTVTSRPSVALDVVVDGSTVLILGESKGPGPSEATEEDDQRWSWIMGSRDGGRTWDDDLAWVGADGSCLRDLERSDGILVAINCAGSRYGTEAPEPRTPQFFVARLGDAATVGWRPLAVVDDPGTGGHDAGLGPGRLVITDRCVFLQGRDPSSRTTLIWRSGQARWDGRHRRIVYDDRDLGVIRLTTGDRMTLGGYSIGSVEAPDNEAIPIGPWIQEPHTSCPARRWVAEQVAPLGR